MKSVNRMRQLTMSRGKRLNRHHKQRMKDKRKNDFTYHEEFPLNKHVITPKLCSCIMCSGARKYAGNSKQGKTMQELRSFDNFKGWF